MSSSQLRQFILNTSLFDSKLWHASPWKLKILIYIITNANIRHSEHLELSIEKGQLLRSYRRIALDCSYKKGFSTSILSSSNIKRYCDMLESEGRISRHATKYGILFTVTQPIDPDIKPKTHPVRPVQKSLFVHHPFMTDSERLILALLDTVEGYPYNLDTDRDFVHSLQADFPSLDLLEHIKDWKTWLWDHRAHIHGKTRYRLRLRNWLKISVEKKNGTIPSNTQRPKPSSKESAKFSDVYES